jgi:hypothetical protein
MTASPAMIGELGKLSLRVKKNGTQFGTQKCGQAKPGMQ